MDSYFISPVGLADVNKETLDDVLSKAPCFVFYRTIGQASADAVSHCITTRRPFFIYDLSTSKCVLSIRPEEQLLEA